MVVHLDADTLLLDARELERRGDDVLLGVFVEVHPGLYVADEVGVSPLLTLSLLLVTGGGLAVGESVIEDALKVVEGFVEENAGHRSGGFCSACSSEDMDTRGSLYIFLRDILR